MNTDPRRWLPNGAWSEIREQVNIPASVAEGKYHLYLWLPDRHTTIANDSRYAVRFANVGVWKSETGYNDLGAEITISQSAPKDPGDMPEGMEETEYKNSQVACKKIIENGHIYIVLPDGRKVSAYGQYGSF